MASENNPNLEGALTKAEPLGPINQDDIGDEAAKSLLDGKVTPFAKVGSNPYMLLLGRKGSGKSAILTEIRLKLRPGRREIQIPEDLPKENVPYIKPVMMWEHFYQITRNVSLRQRFQLDELLADLIPPEYYRELWKEMLWDEITRHFFNYSHFSEARGTLAPVNDYINADAPFQGLAEEEAKRLFDAARTCILDFLEQRNSRLYFLFDSMENYPVRNNIASRVLTGFFEALQSINAEPRIQVSFCVPEELESFLTDDLEGRLDFPSSYRIRWRPIELLRIVAHRFRLAMEVHDPKFYDDIRDLDFSRRDHIHRLFGQMLPKPIHNNLGDEEDPLAYIVRHTQLLPGHVIAIFNAILSRNYISTGGFRRVEERAIREGIAFVQSFIARQILNPYARLYPNLIAACREILPGLNPISCSFDDLKEAEGRFKQRIEEDVVSVWDTLFQMGVIGRVGEPGGDGSPPARQSDRYRYAHFHFNIDRLFVVTTNSEYCFHPIISRYFGMVRPDGDKRVICPANIDMLMLP